MSRVPRVQIEMPDRSQHNFGEDFEAILTTALVQSGNYVVVDTKQLDSQKNLPADAPEVRDLSYSPQMVWRSSVSPSATLKVEVNSLNFTTGSRGESSFYGFNEWFKTIYNDGTGRLDNEFPLRALFVSSEPGWFGPAFYDRGLAPFNRRSGLDLGDGFQIDALVAWLHVKYAKYHSELKMKLRIEYAFPRSAEHREIEVQGDGFFFDVVAGYQQYSAGLTVARRDAMLQALRKAIAGTTSAFERAAEGLPLLAQVDGVLKTGEILLGTGLDSQVAPGLLYEAEANPDLRVRVERSVFSGSIGRVDRGKLSDFARGMRLREVGGNYSEMSQTKGIPSVSERFQLAPDLLSKSNLNGLVPKVSKALAIFKSILEGIFLPYRIYRYFMYDQTYHTRADLGSTSLSLASQPWTRQIGLIPTAPSAPSFPIAVIDSGVDYNHPTIHGSIWLNPKLLEPSAYRESPRKDLYGWDFISNDSRPFDDGNHGTQIASLIHAIAPNAKIMPIKAFNPWGVTHSAVLLASFQYAIENGAKLIVCGWATGKRNAKVFEEALDLARKQGVLVVTAAGDDGVNLDAMPYLPASDSRSYDNVITVGGVNAADQLYANALGRSNFSPSVVTLAAPAEGIYVAEPRSQRRVDSSTGLAAAIVAGSLARYYRSGVSYLEWANELLADADRVPGLTSSVVEGRRLHVRR